MPGRPLISLVYSSFLHKTFSFAVLGCIAIAVSTGCSQDSKTAESKTTDSNKKVFQTISKFSASQEAQVAAATKAKDELGQSLMGELMKSFMNGGAKGSISVCKTKAPEVAKTVSEKHGLKIGRTSFKIRNSENNQPPEWAKGFVAEKSPHATYVDLKEDRMGVLFPIKVNSFCLNCHGEKDKLGEGVAEALAKNYPKDNATGFKDGDLRGYFWVEVPAGNTETKE